ncbi:MAG: hypothetical protein Fur005_15450 [Roseiflexaceae bacterium]
MPSKRRRRQEEALPAPAAAPSRPIWIWIVAGLAGFGLLVAVVTLIAAQTGAIGTPRPTEVPLRQPGPVSACRRVPRFATEQGYQRANFATDDRAIIGLKMFDPENPQQIYTHPSWSSAGYLGPLTADLQGNVYVAPVPRINLIDNPINQQNRIYKVDSNTGILALFLELPAAAPSPVENPYGVLGMTIDCETNSLYVSSIAGSDRANERGRIFRIDLKTATVAGIYEGVDAIGVGVFNTARGKRLYFGLARTSEIRSVSLDAQGNFGSDERHELFLNAPGASGVDRARRINFTEGGEMLVNGRQFDFNMVANTFQPLLLYTYRYRLKDDGWDFVRFDP